jgi:hypothetical protein
MVRDCNVCCEESNLFVRCHCDFEACRKCTEKYILGESKEAACMSCNVVWDRRFISGNFSGKFATKVYKEHLENVLYQRELALVQGTQSQVTELLVNRRVKNEIREIEKQIEKLKLERENLLFFGGRRKAIESNVSRVSMRCPKGDCLGFMDGKYHCQVCETDACSKCREIKVKGHECDARILENVNALKKDTKPCPKCASMIFKIEGCNQMYCVECHTFFDWKTLKIQTSGPRHNPHYFDFQARMNNGNIPRTPGDVLCGRTLDRNLADGLLQEFGKKYMSIVQPVAHLKNYIIPSKFPNIKVIDSKTSDRVLYIIKVKTMGQFRRDIQKREKANAKNQEIRNILELFVQVMTDNLYKLVSDKDLMDFQKSTSGLLEYCNDELVTVSRTYKCVIYNIRDNFTFQRI